MKIWLVLGTGALLAGCGGSSTAVGANSADSVTTTAVGNVVATVPSPTPTPTPSEPADGPAAVTNATAAAATDDTSAAQNAM